MDSNKIKRGLGRGLSSLIGETKVETKKNKLGVIDLVPNKYPVSYTHLTLPTTPYV